MMQIVLFHVLVLEQRSNPIREVSILRVKGGSRSVRGKNLHAQVTNNTVLNRIAVISLVALCVVSCTKIKIEESDAFDAKKTVTVDYFREKGIALEEVSFCSDETATLNAWYFTQDRARGTVIYFGGTGFLLAISGDIIMSIFEQGMNVFAFDYRGYGESTGKPSVQGLKRDVKAAYDYLSNRQEVNPDKLILHGHSMGTIFAVWLANNNDAAGVVLESPITDAKDLTQGFVPNLLRPFISFDIDEALLELSNLREIGRLQKPVLIITGSDDKITPMAMAEKLYKKAKISEKKLYIIDGGGHNDLPLRKEYKKELFAFFQKTLGENQTLERLGLKSTPVPCRAEKD